MVLLMIAKNLLKAMFLCEKSSVLFLWLLKTDYAQLWCKTIAPFGVVDGVANGVVKKRKGVFI